MPQSIAITRAISPAFAACELTHLERVPIDVERARAQHRAYEAALLEAGYLVERLDSSPQMPDSVFVEDIAIVFDEVAIITRPGRGIAPAGDAGCGRSARRLSTAARDSAAGNGGRRRRPRRRAPCLRRPFVAHERRGLGQMRRVLEPLGYTVSETVVRCCLHLKSAVTASRRRVLLREPGIDRCGEFDGVTSSRSIRLEAAARMRSVLTIGSCFRRLFRARLSASRARGLRLLPVDASEMAKAEGAVTCCSLIVAGR